jgi:hypothetical protein
MAALGDLYVTSSVGAETVVAPVSAPATSATVIVAGLPAQGPRERLGVDFPTSDEAPESGEDVDRFWPWLDGDREDRKDRDGRELVPDRAIQWLLPAAEPAGRDVVKASVRRGPAIPVQPAAVLVDAVFLAEGDGPLDSPDAAEMELARPVPRRSESRRAEIVARLAYLGALALLARGSSGPRLHSDSTGPRRRVRTKSGHRAPAGPRGIIRS